MGASMLIVGCVLAVHGTKRYDASLGKHVLLLDSKASSYSVIVFIYVFVASFAYSWGPVNILMNIIINYIMNTFYLLIIIIIIRRPDGFILLKFIHYGKFFFKCYFCNIVHTY